METKTFDTFVKEKINKLNLIKTITGILSASIKISKILFIYPHKKDFDVKYEINSSGDIQKKLEIVSHNILIDDLIECGCVNMIGSEEHGYPIRLVTTEKENYCVVFDPLDGSSNLDCNGGVGTIFGIYKSDLDPNLNTLLQKGKKLIIAGYILYSSSTIAVLNLNEKVYSFTLNRETEKFLLDNEEGLKFPKNPQKIISVNYGNMNKWSKDTKKYFLEKLDDHILRYSGGMVPDIHRIFLYGGIFAYPSNKLRLVYECNPISFLAEKLGFQSTSEDIKILEINPERLHQKISLIIKKNKK